MKIDLHTHSNCSDGTFFPSEVVKRAKEAGLSAIALTDHDTMKGLFEAIKEGERQGIRVIPGVELSCAYQKREVHILGYMFGEVSSKRIETVQKELDVFEKEREERNHIILNRFQNDGFDLKYEDFNEGNPETMVTRLNVAKALVAKGYCTTIDEAFSNFLEVGGRYVPERNMTVQRAMNFFHKHRLFVSLAHPLRYGFSGEELEEAVDLLTGMKMHGLEVLYSTHSSEDVNHLLRLAKSRNLLCTGGSDFHGANKPKIQIGIGFGNLHILKNLLDELDNFHFSMYN